MLVARNSWILLPVYVMQIKQNLAHLFILSTLFHAFCITSGFVSGKKARSYAGQ